MAQEIYQIYDKIFKKILTLSSGAVVNLINGLFGTDYPKDSTITYNWTEFVGDELKRILADTIITINGAGSYHMEAQMTEDDDIIFRVFEYGISHAGRTRVSDRYGCRLYLPQPKIIYLYSGENVPDEYVLSLYLGNEKLNDYRVSTFKFLETDTETLNDKKMVILIPFALLRMRKVMEKERTPENMAALQSIIQNDIIGSVEENLRLGNITVEDAQKLKRLTHKLYEHIYAHYNELEVLSEMTDESLMLDIDIIEKKHEEELAAKDKEHKELTKMLAEKDKQIEELMRLLAEKENNN